MILGKAVFECFYDSRCGDRTGYKGNSNRFEGFWWKTFGGKSSPETMAIARHGRKTCNSLVANEVVDFSALDICSAVIPGASARVKPRVSRTGPSESSQLHWPTHMLGGDHERRTGHPQSGLPGYSYRVW